LVEKVQGAKHYHLEQPYIDCEGRKGQDPQDQENRGRTLGQRDAMTDQWTIDELIVLRFDLAHQVLLLLKLGVVSLTQIAELQDHLDPTQEGSLQVRILAWDWMCSDLCPP
jgi:hypothetical protein